MKKVLVCVLFSLTLCVSGILAVNKAEARERAVLPVTEAATQAETEAATIEETTPPETEAATEAETTAAERYRYIDCPLSEELQRAIFDICEKRNVSFELVMAVIRNESRFKADAVGDHGNSVGLMQIQERWHSGLMEELGVSSLYDPIGNVEVGVALLQQYLEESDGGGRYAKRMIEAGKVSDYAQRIKAIAEEYWQQIN